MHYCAFKVGPGRWTRTIVEGMPQRTAREGGEHMLIELHVDITESEPDQRIS